MADYWDKIKELETTKLSDFRLEKLEEYHSEFAKLRRVTGEMTAPAQELQRALITQMGRLEAEIGRRYSGKQHTEVIGQGGTILFWAKWTFAAAVIVPIAVAVIQEILPSKLHPSKASRQPASAEPSSQPQRTEAPLLKSPTVSALPSTPVSPPK